MQKLIATLKYKKAKDAARRCADLAIAHLRMARFVPPQNCIMTAVPLHARRLRERGFNQADLIARAISEAYAMPYDSRLLTRTLNTPAQAHTHERTERLQNMHNAFICARPSAILGKTVIIVDDVMTTGATLEACAHALKEAGARKVIACVVAK